jgi:hypothetical protein
MNVIRFVGSVCLGVLLVAATGSPLCAAAAGASGEGSNETVNREIGLPKAPAFKTTFRMQADLLAKARSANDDLYSTLQSFVCREEMQRYKGDLKGRTTRPIDTVTANLSFESGVEHYSEIYQNTRSRNDMSSIAGAWSEGEFGTLLRQTEKLLNTQEVVFQAFTTVQGTEAAVYRFDVDSAESPWDLDVAGHHYHLAFQTDVWISTTTGEILKIARKSLNIPAEIRISGIEWTVGLLSVELNDKTWLLPKTGTYAVYYDQSNRREWNEMSFSNYKRYGSEASLRFDEMK